MRTAVIAIVDCARARKAITAIDDIATRERMNCIVDEGKGNDEGPPIYFFDDNSTSGVTCTTSSSTTPLAGRHHEGGAQGASPSILDRRPHSCRRIHRTFHIFRHRQRSISCSHLTWRHCLELWRRTSEFDREAPASAHASGDLPKPVLFSGQICC